MFLIETRNGLFIVVGSDKSEAQINFTIEFPNEKIRTIKPLKEKAVHIEGVSFLSEI